MKRKIHKVSVAENRHQARCVEQAGPPAGQKEMLTLRRGMKRLGRGMALLLTAACLTGASKAAQITPLWTSVVRDEVPAGWWGDGVAYPRILQLHHSARGENNVLLATFQEANAGVGPGRPGYPIYRSEDLGKSWSYVTTVYDPVNTADQQAEWMPHLYELPEDCGTLKKGTILLAGCSVDAAHNTRSCLQLYASKDSGRSWQFLSTIAEGGGLDTGVWEPFLMLVEGELLCYYSDSTEHTVHSQKLVYRSSPNGLTWGGTVDIVASRKQSDRPGMAIVTRLGDDRYFMVYEMVNNEENNGNPVSCKYSQDGKNWGPATSLGSMITAGSKALGSAPYCIWSPSGGSMGTLFVCGTFMRSGRSSTGTDYFISNDYGATWNTLPHPIPYPVSYSHTGYSSPMALSADGKLLFVLNNPPDPNGVTPDEGRDPRARIEFALVELEAGAAALPENQPFASVPAILPTAQVTVATTSTAIRTENRTTTGASDTLPSEGSGPEETAQPAPIQTAASSVPSHAGEGDGDVKGALPPAAIAVIAIGSGAALTAGVLLLLYSKYKKTQ